MRGKEKATRRTVDAINGQSSEYSYETCSILRLTLSCSALTREVEGMIDRQMPSPDGWPKPPTLTSCMRRAFAARCHCHISQNVGKMWEVLSSTSFDELDQTKMVQIVKGEELEPGMKRIF